VTLGQSIADHDPLTDALAQVAPEFVVYSTVPV
jgi:hypothetical protein